jgi:hypothetical protein
MRAPAHAAVRRRGRAGRGVPSALALLLTAVTAVVPMLGGTPASAARATSSTSRPAPAAASYTIPASTGSTSAGGETRRTTRPAARSMAAGPTRRLHSGQDAALEHHRPATRAVDTHHPGQPATGAADPTGPPPVSAPPTCRLPAPSPRDRFLPVGAGRSPPFTCGS